MLDSLIDRFLTLIGAKQQVEVAEENVSLSDDSPTKPVVRPQARPAPAHKNPPSVNPPTNRPSSHRPASVSISTTEKPRAIPQSAPQASTPVKVAAAPGKNRSSFFAPASANSMSF